MSMATSYSHLIIRCRCGKPKCHGTISIVGGGHGATEKVRKMVPSLCITDCEFEGRFAEIKLDPGSNAALVKLLVSLRDYR